MQNSIQKSSHEEEKSSSTSKMDFGEMVVQQSNKISKFKPEIVELKDQNRIISFGKNNSSVLFFGEQIAKE